MKPILNHKSKCRAMCPKGWEYVGHDGDRYLYAKRSLYGGVYKLMRCNESDLTADKLAVMVKDGVSR